MKYSLVELAPVGEGETKHQALHAAVRSAAEAESLGYHRIWYAEHHNTATFAAQDPVSLIALAAAETERIRVGSGAVLLNHYSPFSVAERFLQLEALAPGRIDLGLGRATTGPIGDAALRRDRTVPPVDDFSEQVQEILDHYHHSFEPGHPFASMGITQGIAGVPEIWVLGSSGTSAELAGALGLGYAFAGFINPSFIEAGMAAHRDSFRPAGFGPGEYAGMLALNVVAADDEETAHRLTWPARAMYRRMAADATPLVPTLARAEAELPATAKEEPSTIRGTVIPQQISGTVDSLRAQIAPLVRAMGATEIMVQDLLVDPEHRSRSRALIAEALAGIDTSEERPR